MKFFFYFTKNARVKGFYFIFFIIKSLRFIVIFVLKWNKM